MANSQSPYSAHEAQTTWSLAPLTLHPAVLLLTLPHNREKEQRQMGAWKHQSLQFHAGVRLGKEIMKPNCLSEQHLSDFPMRYQRVFGAIGHKVAGV